jgi:A/G-specific adenine glycosylase
VTQQQKDQFISTILEYYYHHKRSFVWRWERDPYKVMVSEIMLQQTQVERVIGYYQRFLERFPTVQDLANGSLREVLEIWQGLGYNRRAKFVHQAAQMVVSDFGGVLPQKVVELTKLPGVGVNTAGAIRAYAFNLPVVFVETNIRRVVLNFFFPLVDQVSDNEIVGILKEIGCPVEPREWYYALTDYGAHLPKVAGNVNHRSKHYTKQSTFEGSKRQVRANVLKQLLKESHGLSESDLTLVIGDERLSGVLKDLEKEGLIEYSQERYTIK